MMQVKWHVKVGFYHTSTFRVTTLWLYHVRKDTWYYLFLRSIGAGKE